MDADTLQRQDADICCDRCGYLRTGLPDDSACPECGQAPPVPWLTDSPDQYAGDPQMGRLYWLVSVQVGLLLLILTSFMAFRVTLVMPLGRLTLAAMNVPCPKLHGAALLQRSIGGQPGEWGSLGWMAVLGNVLSIWLLTAPGPIDSSPKAKLSIRWLTRWGCIASVGAMLGLLMSQAYSFIGPKSDFSHGLLFTLLVLGELPGNTLLYLHLRKLSITLRVPRCEMAFGRCVWLIAGATIVAAFVVYFINDLLDPLDTETAIGFSVYCMSALVVGTMATSAVVMLLARCWTLTFLPILRQAKLDRLRDWIWSASRFVAGHYRPLLVALGIALWLVLIPAMLEGTISRYPSRKGMWGDIPYLNFTGPKITSMGSVVSYRYGGNPGFQVEYPLMLMLAVYWMTVPLDEKKLPGRLAWWTRWLGLISIVAPIGFTLAVTDEAGRHLAAFSAVCVILAELPATLLLYFHLMMTARQISRPRLAKQLKRVTFVVAGLTLVPLLGFVLSSYLPHWHQHALIGLMCSILLGISLIATFFTCALLGQLALCLIPREKSCDLSIAPVASATVN